MSFVQNELLCSFIPDKISFFGNSVKQVEIYKDGLSIQRKRDTDNFSFDKVDKIIARGYASPTPVYIYISIKLKSEEKDINFKLHPDLVDANKLLGIHSDFLLGKDFPDNLNDLNIELGGVGVPIYLEDGNIILGEKKFPLSDVESFEQNGNGFYFFKLKSLKKKLGISPEYSDNILATLRIFDVILNNAIYVN